MPAARRWASGFESLFGHSLAFSFEGLLLASVIFNLPFAVQPLQRAFETVPQNVREAAWCSGLSSWRTFWRIELPLAWPGAVTALALTFAHTLGEFGVVLMVGGNIPGETRTAAIAIYDRVQAFDNDAAGAMSALLAGAVLPRHRRGLRVGPAPEPPCLSPRRTSGSSCTRAAPIPLAAELDCAPGELTALIGPSGSGKTSILRCIAGLLRPREGRIVSGGHVWLDSSRGIALSPQARRVGLVFQDYALFPAPERLEATYARP